MSHLAWSGDLSLVGFHPTSTISGTPSVHNLKAYDGRIYMGYGDWNIYPPITVTSYDPANNLFRLEYSAPTDSIGLFRELGGKLYLPSTDPVHYADFHDYSVLDSGVWRSFTPSGLFHAFDMGTTGSDLWMVGSKSPNETSTSAVFRSVDNGRNWAHVGYHGNIYTFGFSLRGRFYVSDTVFDGNQATSIPAAGVYKPTAIGIGPDEFIIGQGERTPGFSNETRTRLFTFDGTTWRVLRTNIYDFTVSESRVYTLEAPSATNNAQVWMATSITANQAVWHQLPLTAVTNARSVEVLGGIVYVGDNLGRLWAAHVDGTPLLQPATTVTNLMPDAFGRALSASGSLLAVGAPDFSGQEYLCGQVTIWERSLNQWQRVQTIDPPQPLFAGAFGADMALYNNRLAIVEAVRGSSAKIHLFKQDADQWELTQSFSHPFAHSLVLDSNRLTVATSAALHLFRLSDSNGFSVLPETNFPHGIESTVLYEPIGRVAMHGERVAYGIVGDFSRRGAPGQVNVYEKNILGAWALVTNLLQNSGPLPEGLTRRPDAFGLALALNDNWLAVGAPRDDVAASQAGGVHVYERIQFGTHVSYVLRQTVTSPVIQAEARFGESISFSGPFLVVGAPGIDDDLERQKGKVFVYKLDGMEWVGFGEVTQPSGSRIAFGSKLVTGPELVFAGSRSSAPSPLLHERVAIAPVPQSLAVADLGLSHSLVPASVGDGGALTIALSVTNGGPLNATGTRVLVSIPANLQIENVSGSFACTNSGTELRCVLASQLPVGASEVLVIQGRASLSNACETIRIGSRVAAREFDRNPSNNQTAAIVNLRPADVSLIEPLDGAVISFRSSVQITASLTSTQAIAGVALYANNNFVAGFSDPPFQYLLTNLAAGTYSLTAGATNTCGLITTSSPVTLFVRSNIPPQVAITHPANGTRFPNPTNIPIFVAAIDPDGTLNIGLLTGAGPLRSFTSPPYFHLWLPVTNGLYQPRMLVRDNSLATGASGPHRVIIGSMPDSGTNWVAYYDHSDGPATGNTVSRWDIPPPSSVTAARLRNVASGATLLAGLTTTRSAAWQANSPGFAPAADTTATHIFGGYIDFVAGVSPNVHVAGPEWVRYLFSELDPNYRYNFRATAVRGDPAFSNRWSLVELSGARSFEAAHSTGCITGIPDYIGPNQVAFNSGFNLDGEVVGWDNIRPAPDGTFSVLCRQYSGPLPIGSADGACGYALTAIRLQEVAVPVNPPPAFSSGPVHTTVLPGALTELSVQASDPGNAIQYQWFRNGLVIPGATNSSLVLTSVSTNDAGAYVVIAIGDAGSSASTPAVLTLVQIDIQPGPAEHERTSRLRIHGPPGQQYSIQQRETLDGPGSWTELTNFALPSNPFIFTDEGSRNHPRRFYRVLPLP